MLIGFSLLIILLISYLICAAFNSVLYFYISAFGAIVLNLEILSLFGGICASNIIYINIITLGFAFVVWFKRGHRLLKPNFNRLKEDLRRFLNAIKLDKSLLVLVFGVLFVIGINFILSAFLPVNDYDALGYRGYRALSWAEAGKIFHFTTRDTRNIVMPINSELVYTWIYSLTGKDIGFGFLNFFTFIFTIFGLNSLLKRLKFALRKRVWAIGIYSSFAGVISQISSMQGDLIVGLLVLYSLIFLYDWANSNGKGLIKAYFASLAAALALGTKSTAFMMYLPLLPLVFVYFRKKIGLKKAIETGAKFGGFLILNFAVFSSYNYVLNFIDYGNPFGSEIMLNRHGFFGGFKGFLANFITYNIQLIDFSGFTWGLLLTGPVFKLKALLFGLLKIPENTGVIIGLGSLNSSMSEQDLGFGVTSLLTFFPCALYSIFALTKLKGRIKENRAILYTLGSLFYVWLVVLSFSIGYMPFSVRFMVAFVTLASPVLLLCYRKRGFYKGLVLFFAAFYLFLASTHLNTRPFCLLYEAFKKENSYETFADKTRCLTYPFFKGVSPACEIDGQIFANVKKGDKIGILADGRVLFHNVKIYAAKKGVKAEEVLSQRVSRDNLREYDYIAAPVKFQTSEEFTNEDKKRHSSGEFPKDCLFKNHTYSGKTIIIECGVPNEKILSNGFYKVKEIKAEFETYTEEGPVTVEYNIFKKHP